MKSFFVNILLPRIFVKILFVLNFILFLTFPLCYYLYTLFWQLYSLLWIFSPPVFFPWYYYFYPLFSPIIVILFADLFLLSSTNFFFRHQKLRSGFEVQKVPLGRHLQDFKPRLSRDLSALNSLKKSSKTKTLLFGRGDLIKTHLNIKLIKIILSVFKGVASG